MRCLAVLRRAITLELPLGDVRTWLAAKSLDDVSAIARQAGLFGRLTHDALAYAAQGSAPLAAAARRNSIAVHFAAHLLSPISDLPDGWSNRRVLAARAALLVVGAEMLRGHEMPGGERDFWETALVTRPWLAVRMGCAPQAAGKALEAAVDLGMLRVVQKRPGSGAVFKLARNSAAVSEATWDLYELVAHLAGSSAADVGPPSQGDIGTVTVDLEGCADAPGAALLMRSAAHPAWGGALGHPALLVAICDAVGIDPVVTLGVTKRYVAERRRDLKAAGVVEGCDLRAVLNEHSNVTGAGERFTEVERARLETAAVRKAATLEIRESKAERFAAAKVAAAEARARAKADKLDGGAQKRAAAAEVSRIMRASAPLAPAVCEAPVRAAWAGRASEALRVAVMGRGGGSTPSWQGPLDRLEVELAARLAKDGGYEPAVAKRLAARLVATLPQPVF